MRQQSAEIIKNNCDQSLQQGLASLEILKNKVFYIAGGTGFVGTWVTTLLVYLNQHYNFNTKIFLLARNADSFLPQFKQNKNITLITCDVKKIFELPQETNYVLHAGCTPDNRIHALDPLETTSTIVEGTRNLLTAANRCSKLDKFLYLSSASIYGIQPLALKYIPENFSASAPRCDSILSAYAESKRFAETLCAIFRSQLRLPIVIARPFAFIGPYQSLETPWAINHFIHNALCNEKIKILGNGETIRSYLYGSDVAFWLLSMLAHGTVGESYNLGSDEEINLYSLAHLIFEKAQTNNQIIVSKKNEGLLPTSRLIPSIEKAKRDLGLSVKIPLEEAINFTIEYNKSTYQ